MYNRREFLKRAGLLAGSLIIIRYLPACSTGPRNPYLRVFTPDEAACLGALCDQIIPPDDFAGAREAGAVNFIDKQTALRFPGDKGLISAGIASLQRVSLSLHGTRFEDVPFDRQTPMVAAMEKGELPEEIWVREGQRAFFEKILQRTMQSYYGSPRHGGNRDLVSYRMVGFEYPLVAGQNRYRE